MQFANNWVYPVVYPYSNVMYDPILKVRAEISSYHESYAGDVPIAIYYDPEIEADHLTVPVSEETKARWRSSPLRRHKADDDSIRWSFRSDKEMKIDDVPCRWETVGDTVRLKISSRGETFLQVSRLVKSLNIPIISDDPLLFLLYVYKNYINVPALEVEDDHYSKKYYPSINRAEICLDADAFLNAFDLSPSDYAEVEPGWYCVASKEVVR